MISQMYYFMHCDGTHPIAPVHMKETADIHWSVRWDKGEPVQEKIKEPLVYYIDLDVLDEDEEVLEGKDLAGYGPDDFNIRPLMPLLELPLMRHDLKTLLLSAGADNIEFFEAVIENPVSGTRHENYSAFNIVGVADFEWSRDLRRRPDQREFYIKEPPFLIFRLYDGSPIVVYESVKMKVEEAGIEGMYFIPTNEGY